MLTTVFNKERSGSIREEESFVFEICAGTFRSSSVLPKAKHAIVFWIVKTTFTVHT